LAVAIFDFRLPVMSGSIHGSAIELLDPENVVVAVGTELLSTLETEIYVLPVSTRFGGRHLVFPTSGYVGQFSQ
jgi:hypothetical protein